MSEVSSWDVVDHLDEKLKEAGYSFHSGDVEELGESFWWCWTDGKCDVETGEYCDSALLSLMDATSHWFRNARIEVYR